MSAGIVILIFFIVIVGVAIFFVRKTLKKLDEESKGIVINGDSIQFSKDFIPFEKIEQGMIHLGGFKYRKIIECSSINYDLKTEEEKQMIEAAFSRFLNSVDFPYTFYVQTREIDLSDYIDGLKKDIEETSKIFPSLANYGEIYLNDMYSIPEIMGEAKQKHKYVIVGYDEVSELDELNDIEKQEYASEELNLRLSSIIDGLSFLGIKSKVLNDYQLLELIYSSYHKENFNNIESVLSGDYTTPFVGFNIIEENGQLFLDESGSNNPLNALTEEQRAKYAVDRAKEILEKEIVENPNCSDAMRAIFSNLAFKIEESCEKTINQSQQIKNFDNDSEYNIPNLRTGEKEAFCGQEKKKQ